jgi:pyruvate dehydrogenase (quinone)
MTTVATHKVGALANAGVKRIYGVVDDSLKSIVDAVHKNKEIQWIHVRHEEAGAFAASAEAQLAGNLAVCAGSCGEIWVVSGSALKPRKGFPGHVAGYENALLGFGLLFFQMIGSFVPG